MIRTYVLMAEHYSDYVGPCETTSLELQRRDSDDAEWVTFYDEGNTAEIDAPGSTPPLGWYHYRIRALLEELGIDPAEHVETVVRYVYDAGRRS